MPSYLSPHLRHSHRTSLQLPLFLSTSPQIPPRIQPTTLLRELSRLAASFRHFADPDFPCRYFPIGPFTKYAGNPILSPNPAANFESAYLYNPTAIVLNETIFLLYRAQNESKTSTIGLAWSTDGYNFTRLDRPILYPTEPWEQIGGCEDPRIVRVNSTFYMTYTAFDNSSAQLCMAQSEDLLEWRKQPPLFPNLLECLVLDLITPNLYVRCSCAHGVCGKLTHPVRAPYSTNLSEAFTTWHTETPNCITLHRLT